MAQVLSPTPPHENQRYLSNHPLLHVSRSQTSLFLGSSSDRSSTSSCGISRSSSWTAAPSHPPPDLTSPCLSRTSSFNTLPPKRLTLNTYLPEYDNEINDDDDDDEDSNQDNVSFNSRYLTSSVNPNNVWSPSYYLDNDNEHDPKSNAPTPDTSTSVDDPDILFYPTADDIDVKQEPSRQVDYLSHDWKEEDIWSSWRHIVTRRRIYGEQSRLENASWRTWTKQKYGLRTISPETLNWLKDYDVTWLYGPLQEAPRARRSSEPSSQLSQNVSFLNKKPILKKRSVSEEMLQKSISSSSLVKQAATVVLQSQQSSNSHTRLRSAYRLRRCASDFDGTSIYTESTATADVSSTLPSSTSSGAMSPDSGVKKRIRFDNNVEQCIAVDFNGNEVEEEATPSWMNACSDEESEDDLLTLQTRSRLRPNRTNSSRNSFSSESKGIIKLPSTTLKFHHDEPDCRGHLMSYVSGSLRSPILSPSPSQETLKPSEQSCRSPISEREDFSDRRYPVLLEDQRKENAKNAARNDWSPTKGREPAEEEVRLSRIGMRRTSSGMLMPFEEGEDDTMASEGLLGKIVDTVNTARDICYVLYNVGWRT